jgi:hypothetical protein
MTSKQIDMFEEMNVGQLNSETVTKAEKKKKGEPVPFVVQQLRDKADLFLQRNALYGDNYKRFGPILVLLLEGQELDPSNEVQMNRLGLFVQVVSKMTRYGQNFSSGGHDDSLDDMAVYSMMLKQLDHGA